MLLKRMKSAAIALVCGGVLVGSSVGQEPPADAGKRELDRPTAKPREGAAAPKNADRPDGPSIQFRGKPGDLMMLVREPAVQKELDLSKKQQGALREAIAELDAKRLELLQNSVPGLGPGGGQAPPGARRVISTPVDPVQEESEQALSEILERRQMTRLRQIALQQEGLIAVSREEIADRINLSIPQREAIATILEDMRQAQAELMQEVTGGTGLMTVQAKAKGKDGRPQLDKETSDRLRKMQEGRESIRKTGLGQINKLLTKKQGAAFTKLMGEPFDFTELSPAAQGKPLFSLDDLKRPSTKAEDNGTAKSSDREPPPDTGSPVAPRRKQGRNLRPEAKPNR